MIRRFGAVLRWFTRSRLSAYDVLAGFAVGAYVGPAFGWWGALVALVAWVALWAFLSAIAQALR